MKQSMNRLLGKADKLAPKLLSLRTLVQLRWLASLGQLLAVVIVYFGLGYKLPLIACLLVIGLSVALNIFLSLRWRLSLRLNHHMAGVLLTYDSLQLAALLYLTGGVENPFAFLFIVPVTVSATSLPLIWTFILGGLSLFLVSLLALFHQPLPWPAGSSFYLPPVYVIGIWLAIACGIGFSSIYARRIARESQQMQMALNATEHVLARQQRLSALDGLAAAAAHELGTPLATIALVSKELKRELPADPHYDEDIDLLISQSARCREILGRLANHGNQADEVYDRINFTVLIEDLVAPVRGPDVEILVAVTADPAIKSSPEPIFRRNAAITYALTNLIENAVDFATSKVTITGLWSTTSLSLQIADDGPGFDSSIIHRLGEPYVTTRPGYELTTEPETDQHAGMGLGFFIAKTLLERSGAAFSLSNRAPPDRGAIININWPRKAIDVGKALNRPIKP